MKYCVIGFLAAVLLVSPVVSAETYTETFANYYGYDPDQSTANWNAIHEKLEIYPIQSGIFTTGAKMLDDGSSGCYYLSMGPSGSGFGLFLQHYDRNGYPLTAGTGIELKNFANYVSLDVTVLSDGDILVAWRDSDQPNIYLQRYTTSGSPVWTSPVRANHTPVGSDIWSLSIAPLPGNQSILAFVDDRSGNDRAYIQKITSAGSVAWAIDKQLQNMIFANESNVQVQTDELGNIFVCWSQDDGGDIDIAFTRVHIEGDVYWDPARIANLESHLNQLNKKMVISLDNGIYFGWTEYDGSSTLMEFQRWNYDGTCDNITDESLFSVSDYLDSFSVNLLPTGNILLLFGVTSDMNSILASIVLSPALAVVTPVTVIADPTTFYRYGNVVTGMSSINGGFIHYVRFGDYVFDHYLMKLNNLGERVFTTPRWQEKSYEKPLRYANYFTENSGGSSGFKYTWMDNRAGDMHGFGCQYRSPRQPNQVAQQIDQEMRVLDIKSAEAPDGTVAVLTEVRTSTGTALKLMWCSAQFDRLWKEAVTIREFSSGIYLSFDIDIDSRGRAILGWTQQGDFEDQGVFFQAVSPERQFIHPTPVRVDDALAGSFRLCSIEPVGDGDAIVSWSDDVVGDYHLLAMRVDSSGSLEWPTLLQVTSTAPDYIKSNDLVACSDSMVCISAMQNGGNHFITRYMFSLDGTNAGYAPQVSNSYGYIGKCAAEELGDDIYIVWDADEGTGQTVYMQKLNDGVTYSAEKRMSDAVYSSIGYLDIIPTGSVTMVYAMQGYHSGTGYTLIQQFDTDGNTAYTSEELMISPEPAIYSYQYACSSQMNAGDDIHWATISAVDQDLRGGRANYFLSNDGGANWIYTQPGLPVVFPTSGNDLRWAVDLYPESYQQVSPEINSVTTTWNSSQIGTDLILNQEHFYEGDTFRLSLRHSNTGTSTIVDKYILLDVYGMYWWWPGWSETLDYAQDSITSGFTEDVIFEFEWPADTGYAAGLLFWTALLDPGTSDLVGPWDYVMFSYGQ